MEPTSTSGDEPSNVIKENVVIGNDVVSYHEDVVGEGVPESHETNGVGDSVPPEDFTRDVDFYQEPVVNSNNKTYETKSEEHVNVSVEVETYSEQEPSQEEVAADETDCQANVHEMIEVSNNNQTKSNDNITYETEVVVEEEVYPSENDTVVYGEINLENNILSTIDDTNAELSEALASSPVQDNVDINASKTEVLNNEELLDILEGNGEEVDTRIEVAVSQEDISDHHKLRETIEKQLALDQITKLVKSRAKSRKSQTNMISTTSKKTKKSPASVKKNKPTSKTKTYKVVSKIGLQEITKTNIVSSLVKDWDDEDGNENENCEQAPSAVDPEPDTTQENDNEQKVSNIELSEEATTDGNTEDNTTNKRQSRVIKKKIIFDPDNPDTFTKGKTKPRKTSSSSPVKDPPPTKKGKQEPITPKEKSKSPVGKIQWKKPTPKSNKNNRRLTEVDRLLMDEGAVNMIYQLTPDASKGKANMKNKAELIKNINQSSTPESNQMKFRDRKKEVKKEEPKKIISGKQRSSTTGSLKSASACEEFEEVIADDSIIYRRHSSSSYSSSCMSPRRLSDVESASLTSTKKKANDTLEISIENGENSIFMADAPDTIDEAIKKEDCMTLKQKLNMKLSNALNKRKNETDKFIKQKKKTKSNTIVHDDGPKSFTMIKVKMQFGLAEICIGSTGSPNNSYNLKVLKEIEQALKLINNTKNISVTLLTSDFLVLCSGLDLRPLVDVNLEKRSSYAYEFASSVRNLLIAMEQHSKLLVCGVSGANEGLGLAMMLMCDVSLSSEYASFLVSSDSNIPVNPGLAVLTSNYRSLPQNLITDLVVFGRQLSAAEALQNGLVSRVLLPNRFIDDVKAIARDISSKPVELVLLKKRLLNIKATSQGSSSTLHSCLLSEQDLFVEFWTSVEGQQLLRTQYSSENMIY